MENAGVKRIPIRVNGGYTVCVEEGLLGRCGTLLQDTLPRCRVAVIADTTVAPLYLSGVLESLHSAGFSVCSHVYPAGEASKNVAVLSEILEFLAEEQLTRTDCVAALGGGVCGDMAGFAAAIYLRGIAYVQLPTTLLAAVDSSVGGKTAVDLRHGKNLAGAFHQPSAVICDTACLKSLPPPSLADGIAEAIKTAILSDEELFTHFERGITPADLPDIIARCVAFKGRVVEADEWDTGLRRTLNLGHTAGHAIERCRDFTISHGHAVAIGMVIIARAAEKLGWCQIPCSGRIASALEKNALPTTTDLSAQVLAKAALADKKRTGGDITLVIPECIGTCTLKRVPVGELEAIFQTGLER